MKLEALVSRHYDELNPNDLIIWRYITQNKEQCLNMTIEALAQLCNVSRSTVMRFAQKIGLSGYSELKACLRFELEEDEVPVSRNLVSLICDSNIKAIHHFQSQNYDDICQILYNAKRIFMYGTGSLQKSVCREFQRMMLSLNILVNDIPAEGEVRKVVTTISLTRYGNNTLARMSTKNLFVNIEEVTVLEETNFESMTLMFIILEILFAKLVEYRTKFYIE